MLIGGLPLSPGHHVATQPHELEAMVRELRAQRTRALDFETGGTQWWKGQLPVSYGLGYLGPNGPRCWFVPFGHRTMEVQANPDHARAAFRDALDGAEELVGHNIGFDLNMGRAAGFQIPEWTPLHDTLVQAALINENRRFGLETLVDSLRVSPYDGGAMGAKNVLEDWIAARSKQHRIGKKEYLNRYGHAEVPVAIEAEYTCRDIGHTLILDAVQRSEALGAGEWFEDRRRVLYQNEMLLVRAIADMVWTGQLVDVPYLQALAVELDQYLDEHGKNLTALFGTKIEWNNDNQCRDLLYNRLRLPVMGFTDSGQPSVDRAALMSLRSFHPGIEPLERWRARWKIRTTYTDTLIDKVGFDGRVHTDFVQWGAGTGRLSSRGPNLQNIPSRDPELSPKVRRAFVVEPGMARVYGDYSQIELRVLAWATGCATLVKAYESRAYMELLNGQIDYETYRIRRREEPEVDVHGNVASDIFGVKPGDPEWKSKRSATKIVNFGVPYGGGPNLLMGDPNIRMSESEARAFFETYHRKNPEIAETQNRLFRHMRHNRCRFVNWMGRARHGPRLVWNRRRGGNCPVAAEERSMFASLIQGSAAELTKLSIVRLWYLERTGQIQGRTSSTVHDEIQRDCRIEDVREVALVTQRVMEDFAGMFGTIPVIADLEVTTTDWSEKKDYDPFEPKEAT